ncbi:MAG TPA: response regulator transcription factor [Bryobacteraceae bacterium]|jgi:two-component system NarL family response regulator|nr:response regulator transcription factor [Bryobacteraceae bacterium]
MQSPSVSNLRGQEGKTLDSELIRVLIADDHPVVCLGLLGIINGQPDMIVVGQANSGTEAVELARKHKPDVILMDLRMPGMSGVAATAAIRSERPESAVIVLTTYQGDEDIRKALAAGAQSYLLKGMSHLKLLDAIRSVRAGHQYFPRNIRNSIPEKLNRSALSPRELDILRLIARGLNNQSIADALNITRGTVKWHVNIILRRLDVNDRTQAIIVAAQRGIIEI